MNTVNPNHIILAAQLRITGHVQGVGYRYWLTQEAQALGITGWCRNTEEGAVEAHCYGSPERIETLVKLCHQGPPLALVHQVQVTPIQQIERIPTQWDVIK